MRRKIEEVAQKIIGKAITLGYDVKDVKVDDHMESVFGVDYSAYNSIGMTVWFTGQEGFVLQIRRIGICKEEAEWSGNAILIAKPVEAVDANPSLAPAILQVMNPNWWLWNIVDLGLPTTMVLSVAETSPTIPKWVMEQLKTAADVVVQRVTEG